MLEITSYGTPPATEFKCKKGIITKTQADIILGTNAVSLGSLQVVADTELILDLSLGYCIAEATAYINIGTLDTDLNICATTSDTGTTWYA